MKTIKAAASILLLSSVSALAADLPSIKSAPVAAPTPMWTGFYAGLNTGGTWANNNTINNSTQLTFPNGTAADYQTAADLSGPRYLSNSLGFIGGGQIGYNWQARVMYLNFITGVEADIQGIANSSQNLNHWSFTPNAGFASNNIAYSITTNSQANSNLSWLGTVRGRFGYLVMPSLLVYGTGGLAYGDYSFSRNHTMNSVAIIGMPDNYFNYGSASSSATMVGWAAGGGAEWMFLPNWSLKGEYLYYDLGNISGFVVNDAFGYGHASGINAMMSITNYSHRINGNIIRAGANYHFNLASAPVVAKF